ncbi:MAG TPA: DUF305 domain-containing protein [Vicinamibacterales bacterium]|nr:DUF305 domain-containing protein [Vicinamibacterales bacterium]
MKIVSGTTVTAFLLLAGCASASASRPATAPAATRAPARATPARQAAGASTPLPPGLHATPPGLGDLPYSDADIAFMSGMIPHHAQAVIMAGWAPTHGAREDVAILCERIVVGQRDEIHLMQNWLRDRGLPVPDEHSTRLMMTMNGVQHAMLMPGMLTDEEMAALDRARGPEFDRLFLQGMIKHHEGAIHMVDVLFDSYGGGQGNVIFKFANDVYADQTIEIQKMQQMLEETAGR